MAIGIVFLVMVAFVIPASAVLGAMYLNHLMETRPPPGRCIPENTEARRLRARRRAGDACLAR